MSNIKARIVGLILNDQGQQAADDLISFYGSDDAEIRRVYVQFKAVRRAITLDDSNHNPNYFRDMRAFIESLTDFRDISAASNVLRMSLQDQARLHHCKNKNRTMTTWPLEAEFRAIRPVINGFYDFKLDPEYSQIANEVDAAHREYRHTHAETITKDQMNKIKNDCIRLASSIPDKEYPSREDVSKLLCALLILTGRRLVEVTKSVTFNPVMGLDLQAKVSGILKKAHGERDAIYTIPLLAPFPVVKKAVDYLRAHVHPGIETNYGFANEPTYGRKLDHNMRRNVYIELAFLDRFNSRFAEYNSKVSFANLALRHTEGAFDTTSVYMSMVVN